ncbi:FxSxx-COOH system tetratricopeptide repeat protein [Nonomuraea bangladeshensis]|uniref:FxSxx-COOH system tetratricopeptide repeat protein n=1 Tax=Nonomuraea bangladeshensis TaxID=404385 RepID=UPI003C302293
MSKEPEDSVDPTYAANKEDLARCMRMLRARADMPSYRELEKQALAKGGSLPRTTLSEVLNGKRFPTRAFLLLFVDVCGEPFERHEAWRQVWNRLSVQYRVDQRELVVPEGDLLTTTRRRLEEVEERAERLGADLTQATARVAELGGLVEETGGVWRQAVTRLAEQGHLTLAEQALEALIHLHRALSREHSPNCLALRYEYAMLIAGHDDQRALVLLRELLTTCREALGPNDSLTFTVQRELTRQGLVAPAEPADTGNPAQALPTGWNVEPRNPGFHGREIILTRLRQSFATGSGIQVLRGWSGVGKTQIAIEYAHRFSMNYRIVWWIDAEDPVLIGKQLADLAVQLQLVDPGADTANAVAVLKGYLHGTHDWLLLFDNAEDPALMRKWLPGGDGHVLITSRTGGWSHLAATTHVNVMERVESVELLRTHEPALDPKEADELAAALGDLPLALVQASVFLAETVTDLQDYLRLLNERPREVLSEGSVGDYPLPLAAAIALTINRLADMEPVGLALARLCAFLAPETIPVEWLIGVHQVKDSTGPLAALAAAAGDGILLRRGLAAMSRFGLAVNSRGGIRLHRLTQSVIRDQLTPEDQECVRDHARALLVTNSPGDPEDPDVWPAWSRMVPHLLAVEPATAKDAELRVMACNAGWYLIERGDADASARLSAELYQVWQLDLGPQHPHTLAAARDLARAQRERGQYAEAAELYEEALARAQAGPGPDDPLTIRIEHGYAIDLHLLERYAESHDLQEDAWERYKRVQGVDHPHTLHAANHLARAKFALGRLEEARDLHAETLSRYRTILGDDHPDTLRCANNLAVDLRSLGDLQQAYQLQTDTLTRRRRALGENHPHTLQSAISLVETLQIMGRNVEAHDLHRDTLDRYRRILGENHPETQRAAMNATSILFSSDRRDDAAAQSDTGENSQ